MDDHFFARLARAFRKDKTDSRGTLGVGAWINEQYCIEEEIGRGGMGIVYRVRDIPNYRDAALKIVNMKTANALTRQQFAREAEIASKLCHPHIVATYETGIVNGDESLPFIAMEFAPGVSLSETHGLTYARIIDIGKQICEALEYAHGQGFVYRDLKPGNVILEKRGFRHYVKLLDFGLAKPRGEAYQPHESNLAGTVFYLAPEVIEGQPADVASDLYALGATLYEMITGRAPFSNFDEQYILSQHLEEKVAPLSDSRGDAPPELESIVLRLLEKNPKDRFASAQETYEALDRIVLTRGDTSRGNLPKKNFTANENDVANCIYALEDSPLLTLLNDDELAFALGAQLADEFLDGVWVIELGSLNDPSLVLPTVASTLGVNEEPNRPLAVSLIKYMREKNILLILKRCDHLAGACAQFAETVLRVCPDARIVTTGCQPLNIAGEKCYPITR